eukprot:scaffold14166_cov317-Alexandrium_tamarense.AAC.1
MIRTSLHSLGGVRRALRLRVILWLQIHLPGILEEEVMTITTMLVLPISQPRQLLHQRTLTTEEKRTPKRQLL